LCVALLPLFVTATTSFGAAREECYVKGIAGNCCPQIYTIFDATSFYSKLSQGTRGYFWTPLPLNTTPTGTRRITLTTKLKGAYSPFTTSTPFLPSCPSLGLGCGCFSVPTTPTSRRIWTAHVRCTPVLFSYSVSRPVANTFFSLVLVFHTLCLLFASG
jgi:hypothetical protein